MNMPEKKWTILAEGEATGHAHRMPREDATIYKPDVANDNSRKLVVVRTTDLSHEEHKTISVPPGIYRVHIKRQYSEDEQGWRPVED